MVTDIFGEVIKNPPPFPNAGRVCKEHYTPIDRFVIVEDSDNAGQKALLGILKPHPTDESVMQDAIAQILEAVQKTGGGTLSLYRDQWAIKPITNDPGLRQQFLVQGADLAPLLEELAQTRWNNNPYSHNKDHTIVETYLNLPQHLAAVKPKSAPAPVAEAAQTTAHNNDGPAQ